MRQIIFIALYFFIGTACHQKQPIISQSQKEHLPFYNGPDFTPVWFDGTVPDTIHTIPSFSFIDQNGSAVTEKTVANKIYIADFFFTSCPGICPKLTRNLKLVQDTFRNDDQVVFYLIPLHLLKTIQLH